MILVGSFGKSAGSGGFGVATMRVVDFRGFEVHRAPLIPLAFEERTEVNELSKAKQYIVGCRDAGNPPEVTTGGC